ncbi:hypothetical protein [Spiroplasma endosymbiont of Colias croceus]|uniref:hypothetical protein n=2 Tax=Spiroplasma endosymbiont of Colias croceus TaxID=3066310 RepID=UPI0030CACB2B
MKTWIKINLSKITLALALTGATTGTIGLIMGGMLTHNVSGVKYFLTPHKQVEWGVQKIWMSDIHGISVDIKNEFKIYFSDTPEKTEFYNSGNTLERIDISWDGNYPDGYFW